MEKTIQGPFAFIQFNGAEAESFVFALQELTPLEKKYLDQLECMHAEDINNSNFEAYYYVSSALGHEKIQEAFEREEFEEKGCKNYDICVKVYKKWEKHRVDSFKTLNDKYGGSIKGVYAVNFMCLWKI